MGRWGPIANAPREIGRPLLLFPRPRASGSVSMDFEGYWDGESW